MDYSEHGMPLINPSVLETRDLKIIVCTLLSQKFRFYKNQLQ